jgi:hypothetical protein
MRRDLGAECAFRQRPQREECGISVAECAFASSASIHATVSRRPLTTSNQLPYRTGVVVYPELQMVSVVAFARIGDVAKQERARECAL